MRNKRITTKVLATVIAMLMLLALIPGAALLAGASGAERLTGVGIVHDATDATLDAFPGEVFTVIDVDQALAGGTVLTPGINYYFFSESGDTQTITGVLLQSNAAADGHNGIIVVDGVHAERTAAAGAGIFHFNGGADMTINLYVRNSYLAPNASALNPQSAGIYVGPAATGLELNLHMNNSIFTELPTGHPLRAGNSHRVHGIMILPPAPGISDAVVNITVEGENTIRGIGDNTGGIFVPPGATLTINGVNGNDADNILHVVGGTHGIGMSGFDHFGDLSAFDDVAPPIGMGDVIIESGTVTAYALTGGGFAGPGIGVGAGRFHNSPNLGDFQTWLNANPARFNIFRDGRASSALGSITITGGVVTATGGTGGAGIGSGTMMPSPEITITGGTVIATGRGNGAGIGTGAGVASLLADANDNGWVPDYSGLMGDITITGGDVTAIAAGNAFGSGIGLGAAGMISGAIGGASNVNFTIGGDIVHTSSAEFSTGNILITGGRIAARSGDNNNQNTGAAIGGGPGAGNNAPQNWRPALVSTVTIMPEVEIVEITAQLAQQPHILAENIFFLNEFNSFTGGIYPALIAAAPKIGSEYHTTAAGYGNTLRAITIAAETANTTVTADFSVYASDFPILATPLSLTGIGPAPTVLRYFNNSEADGSVSFATSDMTLTRSTEYMQEANVVLNFRPEIPRIDPNDPEDPRDIPGVRIVDVAPGPQVIDASIDNTVLFIQSNRNNRNRNINIGGGTYDNPQDITLIFDNIDIYSNTHVLNIGNFVNVTIKLIGENSLVNVHNAAGVNVARLENVDFVQTVIITSYYAGEHEGSLYARGGPNGHAAGINAANRSTVVGGEQQPMPMIDLIIRYCTIQAFGGGGAQNPAGIGGYGGNAGGSRGATPRITIDNAVVHAEGSGAGIGSARDPYPVLPFPITITGERAVVTAISTGVGAGIGSGGSPTVDVRQGIPEWIVSAPISILDGATVTATGAGMAAGIGGGGRSGGGHATGGVVSDITISNATVTATAGPNGHGAGIGGGGSWGGDNHPSASWVMGTILIENSEVVATGAGLGAGIGGGGKVGRLDANNVWDARSGEVNEIIILDSLITATGGSAITVDCMCLEDVCECDGPFIRGGGHGIGGSLGWTRHTGNPPSVVLADRHALGTIDTLVIAGLREGSEIRAGATTRLANGDPMPDIGFAENLFYFAPIHTPDITIGGNATSSEMRDLADLSLSTAEGTADVEVDFSAFAADFAVLANPLVIRNVGTTPSIFDFFGTVAPDADVTFAAEGFEDKVLAVANLADGGAVVIMGDDGQQPTRLPAPEIAIDFAAETLIDFSAGQAYTVTVGGDTVDVAAAITYLAIDTDWLGETLTIVAIGNNVTTLNSLPQTLAIPARPNAPTGLAGVSETADNANDGRITGVNDTMEFSDDNGATWTAVTGDEITNLAPGAYLVRVAATTAAFAGATASVNVSEHLPVWTIEIDDGAQEIKATLNASLTESGVMILAVYSYNNGQRQLVAVTTEDAVPGTGNTVELAFPTGFPATGNWEVRAFVWSCLEDMAPLVGIGRWANFN